MRLLDRTAIVTGGSRGIGKAYAQALCAEGAKVCIADILDEEGEKTVRELEDKGAKVFYSHTDIRDEKNFQSTAKRTSEAFGAIDILVNNAALYGDKDLWDPLTGSLDKWDQMMSINVKGILIGIRSVAPYMIERKRGSIINQSSITAYFSGGDYGTSKLAVLGLTVGFASLLGPNGVRVNAIAPGLIYTEATLRQQSLRDVSVRQSQERTLSLQAIKKAGEPQDLCGALIFLASDESSWMTGETLVVDGGWMKRI